VAEPIRIGGKALVLRQLRPPQHFRQFGELPVVADGDHHLLIGGAEGLVRHDVGVGVSEPFRHLSPTR